MRKLAFVSAEESKLRKIMLYECRYGTYLFGYDTVYDMPGLFDNLFDDLADAESSCEEDYGIGKEDWIPISDPRKHCQHDLIMPIRIKGRENGQPQWGRFEIFSNGTWADHRFDFDKHHPLQALLGNERLILSGLWDEFEQAKVRDREKAGKILVALQFDGESMAKLLCG